MSDFESELTEFQVVLLGRNLTSAPAYAPKKVSLLYLSFLSSVFIQISMDATSGDLFSMVEDLFRHLMGNVKKV